MRIATWNINGLRARLEFVLLWLADRRPDIVGLQELKLEDGRFPTDDFERAGYHAVTHGQKSWNGVAILTRESPTRTQTGLPGQEEMGARLLTADVADLSFTTVYVPNGKSLDHEDYPRKLAWLDALESHFRQRHDPKRPLVLCGDFNLTPTALDSWNEELLRGHVHHTDEERRRFASLLGWGFHDLFRDREPELQAFSWWDYRGGAFHRKQGLRIDFLLGSEPVAQRVTRVEIDREYRKKKEGRIASDHAPVIADLE